jgi:hypothetical protein
MATAEEEATVWDWHPMVTQKMRMGRTEYMERMEKQERWLSQMEGALSTKKGTLMRRKSTVARHVTGN